MFRIAVLVLLLGVSVAAQAPPNIVYILADDMGYGDVSCLNSKAAWKTPHIDRLAAEGMAFTDAHSGSSVCTPTRYGILTGRYAWRTRLKRGVLGGASEHLIDPQRMTVASYLKKHGYQTACIGKWHLGMDFSKRKDAPEKIDFSGPVTNGPDVNGFDHYHVHNGSLDMAPYVYVEDGRVTAAPDRRTVNRDYQGFWRAGETGADFVHEDVLPNFTRRGAAWVRKAAQAGKPFFLYLPLPAPHTPILPTDEFKGKSGTNPYGDFVLQVDATVGALMKAVEESGVSENTLFIVTADNGCSPRAKFDELAKHGHHPSGPFRGHKADIYEGGHRVPFVARWPARVKARSRSAQTICLTDLLRTCADILGDPLPENAGEDSFSILPALDGKAFWRIRTGTVHHSVNGSFAIRQSHWKLILCPGSGGWSAPVPKVARDRRLPLVQLYDLDADVGETKNLADERPDVVKRLTDTLASYVRHGRSTPGVPQKNTGRTEFLPKPYPAPKPFEKDQVVYKTVGKAKLKLHVWRPRRPSARPRGAIVFFHGGGWNGGNPNQFFPHCEHLALKDMVAISAEYRVKSRHGATPWDCVADARSAIRFVRKHASQLGIDPDRIAAGGGSAGGHLAAATGALSIPTEEAADEKRTSSRPNALVLFNPVFDNGPGGWGHGRVKDRWRQISPMHNLGGKALPPTVIFLGTQDELLPVGTAERYRDLMQKNGGQCDLHLYEGQGHGFFNHRNGKNPFYEKTVGTMEAFLGQHGILAPGKKRSSKVSKPNFVVILADDMGYGDSSVYDGWLDMPQLERLAREGLTFTDFHTSGTVCSPTRAGLLTGRYQHRAGVPGVINADPKHPSHGSGLREEEVTLAEALRAVGYDTAIMGKWHLGYHPRHNPLLHGFDTFRGFISGNIDYASHYDRMQTHDWWHDRLRVHEPGYLTHLITKHAVDYIAQERDRPFFLYVPHGAPHSPIQGPRSPPVRGPEAQRPDRGNRGRDVRAMMNALDQGVGEILDALRDHGLDENTFVIFLSDNGGAGHMRSDPLRGRKGSPWEGGHRVPAIARWPGRIAPGTRTDALCSSLDVMPTLLRLAGARAPRGRPFDGRIIRGVLERGESIADRRLYWDRAMRDGTWKMVLQRGGPHLFDLSTDIGEKKNVAADHPERVKEMRAAHAAWKRDVTPPRPPHVVLVLADDMGWGDAGCNNPDSKTPTPHIDALAAAGMRFTDAHSAGALCVPTRYGLLTGRYPFRWKRRRHGIDETTPTLPALLAQRGYQAAMVGKWHLGFPGWRRGAWNEPMIGGPVDRGFRSWFGIPASLDIPPYYWIRDRNPVAPPTERIAANHTEGWTRIQGAFWREGGLAPGFRHEDVLPRLAEEAEAIIAKHGTARPLFLYLALPSPHTPWLPTEEFRGRTGTSYGDFVLQTDAVVGRVVAALEKRGMTDDTLIVFTSDNGPVWYPQDVEKHGHASTGPYRGMKADAWEGGHRVPFVVRWPGRVEPGTTSDETICQTDLMATFAAVGGAHLPEYAAEDSIDLSPVLEGRKLDGPLRAVTIHKQNASAIRSGRWKLITHAGSGGFSRPGRSKGVQLYDLAADPGETENLAAAHPDVVAELRGKLAAVRSGTRTR